VRVVVTEPGRPGLAEEVRALVPNAIDIRVAPPEAADGAASTSRAGAGGPSRAPGELFAAFLAEQHVADPRLDSLFARLLDTVTTSAEAG
jgi:exonuclease SbcD